jgi:phosphohistidine phosphatase
MDLYVIRHADAAPLGEGGVTIDANRPLTPKGQEQSKRLAIGLAAQDVHLGIVVTSPLMRARQTADGLRAAWTPPAPELRISEELAPGGKRKKLARFLRDLGAERVAIIGHQPELAEFAGWLIGSRKANLDLAKAGVAYIVCDPKPGKGNGRLVWQVTPAWFANGSS